MLYDIARSNPGLHELHGFDISAGSFIHAAHLPPNVQLHVADAMEAPPKEYQDYFDIVHVRLLQSVVKDNDPGDIIRNCITMLRPGGYLQWEEPDPMPQTVMPPIDQPASGSKSDAAIGAGLQALTNRLRHRAPNSWIAELPTHFSKHGLDVVAAERRTEAPWHHAPICYLDCLVWEEFATTYLDKHGPPDAAEAVSADVRHGMADLLAGAYTTHKFQTVVGRRRT